MNRPSRALQLLREHPELAQLAAYPFNFDLMRAEHVEAVRLASGAPIEPIAGDDTGGTYFVCADGAVLYAGSEGEAGLIGDSVEEALEVLIGLPGWHDYTHLRPDMDDTALIEAITQTESELGEYYGPELHGDRTALLVALGLSQPPGQELIRRLHGALLRTEPDHLLLNADEDCAYRLLDTLPRPSLRQLVLEHAAPGGETPTDGGDLHWAGLARRQGRTELARCALLRMLDCGPRDAALLGGLAEELTLLGDIRQAARAQHLYASLQDDPEKRRTAHDVLAALRQRSER
ncbi:hypothetical protein ABIA33_007133 [Streptacidiphilus sp. MAP12-16]|uniref:hypothetical protein n=1 Tax=Streptacidiphilus sp. MAP12-16 TaxID=3156300 RepID=UPI0035152FAA